MPCRYCATVPPGFICDECGDKAHERCRDYDNCLATNWASNAMKACRQKGNDHSECTLPWGHAGPHIACGGGENDGDHNLLIWP